MATSNTRVYWLVAGLLVALAVWQRDNLKEGTNKIMDKLTPRGIRNNNPGNLKRGIAWQGLSDEQTDAVFCQFKTPEYGIRALSIDMVNKHKRGLVTIRQIIDVYAPPIENNTAAYIAAVAKSVGKGPDDRLTFPADLRPLMLAIIQHENGRQPYTLATIDAGLSLAGVA